MNVTLASSFRNSTAYLPRYFAQVIALADALHTRGDKLSCLWGEGDSHDDGRTLAMLHGAGYRIKRELIDCTHGGKPYGSIVNLQRFRQLAHVGNTIWTQIPKAADVFVWVESDLIWDAETLLRLIDRLEEVPAEYPGGTRPCVAPMVLDSLPDTGAEANVTWYDTFVYRRNGQQFTKPKPYHPDLQSFTGKFLQLDSAGSCLVIPGELARGLEIPIADVLIGTCRQIYERGASVWLDTTATIYHP